DAMALKEQAAQFAQDIEIAHRIVHGDAVTVVQTAGGPVRTLAKLVADKDADINAAANGVLAQANAAASNANGSAGAAAASATSAAASAADSAASAADAAASSAQKFVTSAGAANQK
ncbi:hypothetical protein, partial [Klebsiella pneumoniae]|uniref:hypothetical protein n=1 Tax=Klebsiella pneumoniae TaxID=573 RepID=UPI001E3E83CD